MTRFVLEFFNLFVLDGFLGLFEKTSSRFGHRRLGLGLLFAVATGGKVQGEQGRKIIALKADGSSIAGHSAWGGAGRWWVGFFFDNVLILRGFLLHGFGVDALHNLLPCVQGAHIGGASTSDSIS